MSKTEDNVPPSSQTKLVDVELTTQNVALNVIIGFITLGQQRGVYSIQESAKIWECIKMFQQQHVASNEVERVEEWLHGSYRLNK